MASGSLVQHVPYSCSQLLNYLQENDWQKICLKKFTLKLVENIRFHYVEKKPTSSSYNDQKTKRRKSRRNVRHCPENENIAIQNSTVGVCKICSKPTCRNCFLKPTGIINVTCKGCRSWKYAIVAQMYVVQTLKIFIFYSFIFLYTKVNF